MSASVNQSIEAMIHTLLEEASGEVLVIDPSAAVIEGIVEVGVSLDDPLAIKLLAADAILKDVTEDFLIASNAADLIAAGRLAFRSSEHGHGNEIILTGDRLTALVSAGDTYAALSTDDDAFVSQASAYYAEQWDGADDFYLRTPPLSQVRETLQTEISEVAEADFEAILASLETARGNGNGLDEVTISLLVAAKNEELLYDISKWGEDIGIASKATFSRTKTRLEDFGLIDTEKVPIDVGRPRLRLKFADERLRNASADELASIAQSLMR